MAYRLPQKNGEKEDYMRAGKVRIDATGAISIKVVDGGVWRVDGCVRSWEVVDDETLIDIHGDATITLAPGVFFDRIEVSALGITVNCDVESGVIVGVLDLMGTLGEIRINGSTFYAELRACTHNSPIFFSDCNVRNKCKVYARSEHGDVRGRIRGYRELTHSIGAGWGGISFHMPFWHEVGATNDLELLVSTNGAVCLA